MKRETFEIKANGVLVTTKHAWNSSKRAIESKINEIAESESTVYELTDYDSIKEGFYFTYGYRVWTGRNGNIVKFEIKKVS
jgi:hypothetical protein